MTLEYLAEQKEKYQEKANYFKNIEFYNLASDFQGMVYMICTMEDYIKAKDIVTD